MILYQDMQYAGDANGVYNTVPTTATMLFHLGKKNLIFHVFLFFSYPLGKPYPVLPLEGWLAYFHELGFAFQPPSHGMSDWVMLKIHLGR